MQNWKIFLEKVLRKFFSTIILKMYKNTETIQSEGTEQLKNTKLSGEKKIDMNINKIKRVICCMTAVLLCVANTVVTVKADEVWPGGPHVEAPSICVMEITTGTILYENHMDEVNYPASITKIMTGLLAVENSSLDEIVTFSMEAVYGNEGDTSHISRDINEKMTMEQCLYGMMLESANECAYAIGEHIGGGSMETFTKMMNNRAAELGCTNTHFNNPNGLPDEDHWTSAHDMALIAAEAYRNDTFRAIMNTKSYTIPPTNKHADQTPLHNHHLMIYPFHGNYSHLYDYCVGGKTGYTNAAGSTLVSYAEKDDLPIVCVVMREKSPNHYTDTRAVFDYCFENYKLLHVADYESDAAQKKNRVPFTSIDEDATVVVPINADFEDLHSEISYDDLGENVLGTIQYTYADRVVGKADVRMNDIDFNGFQFTTIENEEERPKKIEEAESEQKSIAGIIDEKIESVKKSETDKKTEDKNIHIEINPDHLVLAVLIFVGMFFAILIVWWTASHTYILRQKIAMMKNRRAERNRYQTIPDMTRSRKKSRRREKRSKHLHF